MPPSLPPPFLSNALDVLPKVAALQIMYDPTSKQASAGLMTANAAKTQLSSNLVPLNPGETRKYQINVEQAGLATFEPCDWPSPCCEIIATALGTPMAFEDNTDGRLPWGSATQNKATIKTVDVTYNDKGILTMSTPTGSTTQDLTGSASGDSKQVRAAFIAVRAQPADTTASLRDVTKSPAGPVADFVR